MAQTGVTIIGWKTAVRTIALNLVMIIKLATVTSTPKLIIYILAQLKEAVD